MRHGKPLWRVMLQSTKNKAYLRTYYVIAPEMEITTRGTRSNQWSVIEACQEKGFTAYSALFLGFVSLVPEGAIDLSKVNENDELDEVVENKDKFNRRKIFKK